MTTEKPPRRTITIRHEERSTVSATAIIASTDQTVPAVDLPESDEKPPHYAPRISAVPQIRQLYWCDFPKDGHLPEFWKTRPVIIVSFKNTLSGAVTVIPCSSKDQNHNKWAYQLTTTVDGKGPSWAICDKPTTVAVSRLSTDRSGVRRLPEAEFQAVLALLFAWLPKLNPPA